MLFIVSFVVHADKSCV